MSISSRSSAPVLTSEMYDPQFASKISEQMRVPDHIRAHTSDGRNFTGLSGNRDEIHSMAARGTDKAAAMRVPDKILVAGGDQHVEAKDSPLSDMQYDMNLPGEGVSLQTPPRKLTVDKSKYPVASTTTDSDDDGGDDKDNDDARRRIMSKDSSRDSNTLLTKYSTTRTLDTRGSSMRSSVSVDERLDYLGHRLARLEEREEQWRQREVLGYFLMTGYMIWSFIKWLKR